MFKDKTFDPIPTTSHKSYTAFSGILLVMFFLISACSEIQINDSGDISNEILIAEKTDISSLTTDELLQEVKKATARFNSTTQAIRTGYLPDDHCAAIPGVGGMGYHWVNPDFIFGNGFDPLQPEALLYEADKNGNLKLVGVEYIVIDEGQGKPSFGDHPFDDAGAPPLEAEGYENWTLHVWLYKDNPSGIFNPWNPNVSCP